MRINIIQKQVKSYHHDGLLRQYANNHLNLNDWDYGIKSAGYIIQGLQKNILHEISRYNPETQ